MKKIFLLFWLAAGLTVFAEEAEIDGLDIYTLEDVEVTEEVYKTGETGKTEIPREMLKNLPKGNGSVNDMLRIAPGVQFDEDYRTSSNAGEIKPADISISGGKPYENLFLVDGMNNSSLLNPAGNNAYLAADVPGNPQKFFLDLWLVEDAVIYDSNIPASFDGFSGGVVDVTTKLPGKDFSGKFSYRTTRSEWTHYYVADEDMTPFKNSDTPAQQPQFRKNFYFSSLNIPIGKDTGMIAGYGRAESTVPLKYFNEWKTQDRLSENYFLKAVHNFNGTNYIDAIFSYNPYEELHFIRRTKESDFTIKGGGYYGAVNYHNESKGKLKIHADYSYAENSRESPPDYRSWRVSRYKPWGETFGGGVELSHEGGWGSINKEEEVFTVKLDHNLPPAELLGKHEISYGPEYKYTRGRFNRVTDAIAYSGVSMNQDIICRGDSYICSDGDQYFTRRIVSPQSDVNAYINAYTGYIEDKWWFYRFKARLGVRAGYDDFLGNTNLAPRTQLQYDFFADNKTIATVGYSRYYSSNLLSNKLKEAILPQYIEKRSSYHNVPQEWLLSGEGSKVTYNFAELNTPYSDEYMAGIEQRLFGGTVGLKYLERQYRDQFGLQRDPPQTPNGAAHFHFNNDGRSDYKSVQLKWQRGWKKHQFMINGVWEDSQTSNETYNDNFDAEDMDDVVFYNNGMVHLYELPKDNYNRPFVVNLAYTGQLSDHLNIGLIMKYKSGYRQLEVVESSRFWYYGDIDPETGEPEVITAAAYEEVKLGETFTADIVVSWEQKIYSSHKITATLEVTNLFNNKNRVGRGIVSYGGTVIDKYELGRQFWAGLAYEF